MLEPDDGALHESARVGAHPYWSQSRSSLSVIVPAHNSAKLLEATLSRFALELEGVDAELIVVENGSEDDTPALLQRLQSEWAFAVPVLACSSPKGLGCALRVGTEASTKRWILWTADDMPFMFSDLHQWLRLHDKPSVAVGSKAHERSVVSRGRLRQVLTAGFLVWRRAVLAMHTRDPQGTFIIDGTFARALVGQLTEQGFLFTTEMAYASELAGASPVELPIELVQHVEQFATRIRANDVVRMAVGTLKLRRRRRQLRDEALRAKQLN